MSHPSLNSATQPKSTSATPLYNVERAHIALIWVVKSLAKVHKYIALSALFDAFSLYTSSWTLFSVKYFTVEQTPCQWQGTIPDIFNFDTGTIIHQKCKNSHPDFETKQYKLNYLLAKAEIQLKFDFKLQGQQQHIIFTRKF